MMLLTSSTWRGPHHKEPDMMEISSSVRPYFLSRPSTRKGRTWMGLEEER